MTPASTTHSTPRSPASAQQAAGDIITAQPATMGGGVRLNEEMTMEPQLTVTWDGDRAAFAKAFIAAQKSTEAVKKAATNPAFRSKYADLSEVVEATVPALNANGIGVIQSPGYDGDRVSVTTILLHESGASVTGVLTLRPSKADPQGVGSAITYGRRYSLLAMTGAAPEDDDGNAASRPDTTKREAPKATTLADRAELLRSHLDQAEDAAALDRVWKLGEKLRADLDRADPELLAELETLYDGRRATLTEARRAA